MKTFSGVIRVTVTTAALVLAASACKGKSMGSASGAAPSATASSSSMLIDLSTSLDPVRAAFNAYKQEARFLTLLSPA